MILSEATRAKILQEADRYPMRRTALLPGLKLAQGETGYLPPEIVAEVADLVGVSHAAANELLTFYSMLYDHPVGGAVVEVCVQIPCAFTGGERLLRRLAEGLGVQPGGTTPDGLVTLVRTHECFGACHRAPMCRVNDEYHEDLDKAATDDLVRRLKSGALGREQAGSESVARAAGPRAGAAARPTKDRPTDTEDAA